MNKQRFVDKQEELKAEQEKKEYIAKRKNECYSIYEKEREEWSNVKGMSYSKIRDVCIVKYESNEPVRSKEECNKIIERVDEIQDDKSRERVIFKWSDCLENLYSKEF